MPEERGEFDNLRDALDDYRQRRGPRDVVPRRLPTLADSDDFNRLAAGAHGTATYHETTITDDGVTTDTTTENVGVGRPLLGRIQDKPEGKNDDD
ncbi:hypothetical protein A5675_15340 [Mycobacterium malmoense]|uniref:hypothetical protein n=1 Tax=Mycobacterium malmoense TaxID=1780 RepID=UPI00080B6B3E|nr:hypothetical protein [Mycobacterium malmoense]OCB38762.1 hypothetical protein A5675_15340 [Mycobacterium malmoense]